MQAATKSDSPRRRWLELDLLRTLAVLLWWLVLIGSSAVVALDHAPALHQLGVTRTGFLLDVVALFKTIAPTAIPLNPKTSQNLAPDSTPTSEPVEPN